MNKYVVATIKPWNADNFRKLKQEDKNNVWFLINKKEDLTAQKLKKINPRYVFFPHWSWIIPPEIYTQFECVVFHMTDLPYGRGGSPLQNLISRGHAKTKISALKVDGGLDTGPIYFKKNLSLLGNAEVIYRRASNIIFRAIRQMAKKRYAPRAQRGNVVAFARRKPEEGNVAGLQRLSEVYDYIRMLDAATYPRAFLQNGKVRVEFSDATLKNGKLTTKAHITIINNPSTL